MKSAIDKLMDESEHIKGVKQDMLKIPVLNALCSFCEQEAEFAQAVEQGGSFQECLDFIVKNCGKCISDMDAYSNAVKFYFPTAEIQFCMNIELNPQEQEKVQEIKMEHLGLALDDLLNF